MMALALSIMGVACSVLEQLIEAGRSGVSILGNFFCQTIAPLAASSALSVSSMPTVKTRSLDPLGVATPPVTTGAVRVERISALDAVVSWVFHKALSLPTDLFDRTVSPRVQPVRCWS